MKNLNQSFDDFLLVARGSKWWWPALATLFLAYWLVGWSLFFLPQSYTTKSESPEIAQLMGVEIAQANNAHQPMWNDAETLAWQSAQFPHSWRRIWPHYDGVVWYRAQFIRDKTHLTQQAIFLSYAYRSAHVFVNGKLIGATTEEWPPKSSAWQTPSFWMIPDGLLNSEHNEIRIAVMGEGQTRPGLGEVQIGNAEMVFSNFKLAWHIQQLLPMLSIICFFIIFIVLFVIWSFYREFSFLLWLSFSTLSLTLMLLKYIPVISRPINDVFGFYGAEVVCEVGCLFVGPSLITLTLRMYGERYYWQEKILWFIAATSLVFILFYPPEIFYAKRVIAGVQAGLLPSIATMLGAWYALQPKQNIAARYVSLLMIGVPLASMVDPLRYLDLYPGHVMYHSFVFIVVFVLAVMVVILNFTQFFLAGKIYTNELTKQLQVAESTVQYTLKKQHEIELKTTRTRERALLWKGMHDGFSNTLERLEAVLEQGGVSQPQMVARLKAMREDLRSIMRNNSGDSKINLEETLANVRRSLLDKLSDANINWQWEIIGDQIVSHRIYLLMPMIVREALTNVLKHSQATVLKCQFAFSDYTLDVLIEDNGIGLLGQNADLEASEITTRFGLGLTCMQMHIESLGGKLAWRATSQGVSIHFNISLKTTTDHTATTNI